VLAATKSSETGVSKGRVGLTENGEVKSAKDYAKNWREHLHPTESGEKLHFLSRRLGVGRAKTKYGSSSRMARKNNNKKGRRKRK